MPVIEEVAHAQARRLQERPRGYQKYLLRPSSVQKVVAERMQAVHQQLNSQRGFSEPALTEFPKETSSYKQTQDPISIDLSLGGVRYKGTVHVFTHLNATPVLPEGTQHLVLREIKRGKVAARVWLFSSDGSVPANTLLTERPVGARRANVRVPTGVVWQREELGGGPLFLTAAREEVGGAPATSGHVGEASHGIISPREEVGGSPIFLGAAREEVGGASGIPGHVGKASRGLVWPREEVGGSPIFPGAAREEVG
jgi:hypothetical protein